MTDEERILKVSIINYKRQDMLKNCLESVFAQKTSFPFQVEVVDNASGDGSVEMIKENFSEVNVIENKSNLGYAKAANKALKNGNYKYNLILNNDTKLGKDCLNTFIKFMEETPDCGIAGPLFLNYDDTDNTIQFENSGYRFISLSKFIKHALLEPVKKNNSATAYYQMADLDKAKIQEVDWVNGAAMCLRSEPIKAISFFDEEYFMFVEDMDICYRLKQTKKWKVFLVSDIRVKHFVGKNRKDSRWFSNNMRHIKSIWRFYKKVPNILPLSKTISE